MCWIPLSHFVLFFVSRLCACCWCLCAFLSVFCPVPPVCLPACLPACSFTYLSDFPLFFANCFYFLRRMCFGIGRDPDALRSVGDHGWQRRPAHGHFPQGTVKNGPSEGLFTLCIYLATTTGFLGSPFTRRTDHDPDLKITCPQYTDLDHSDHLTIIFSMFAPYRAASRAHRAAQRLRFFFFDSAVTCCVCF